MRSSSAVRASAAASRLTHPGFNPHEYERPGVSADEVLEMKDAFDLFDPQRTGFASTQQLLASLEAQGPDAHRQPLYMMIADRIDVGIMEMDFEQFLDMMTNRVSNKDTRQDMRKIFNMFDEQKTGFINLKSLKKIVMDLGETIDDSQMQEMIEKADLDKDGLVSEEEFYLIMTKREPKNH